MAEHVYTVVIREAQEICPGDVIWAPDDGEWLAVERIETDRMAAQVFYRGNGSEASFDYEDSNVLVLVQ